MFFTHYVRFFLIWFIMKKFITCFVTLFLVLIAPYFFACEQQSFLTPYVSEYRKDVFEGQGQNHKLIAYYGYRESPYLNDGKVSTIENGLTFILLDAPSDNVAYTLTLETERPVTLEFIRLASGRLIVFYEIDNFSLKEFNVTVKYGSSFEPILLKSKITSEHLDLDSVLKILEKEQKAFIDPYTTDGYFNAEIHARIIVKDQKPYWYMAIADGKRLKAFLVDATSGEILAIREIL